MAAYGEIFSRLAERVPGMGVGRATAFIERGSRGAGKLGRMAEKRMATTASTARYSAEFAAKHKAATVSLRQAQVGMRYAGGAVGIAGAMAMRPNSNQSRTAYRGPMQTGRGVGRFA
jgi:hypothetical protein